MTGYVMAPAGHHGDIAVLEGPRLLSGISRGSSLEEHRVTWREPEVHPGPELLDAVQRARILGRGGAAFPFARKLDTAIRSGRKREVIVNAAEGEPASAKDSALMLTAPHLVLDGAELVARTLKVRTVRVIVPGERPPVQRAVAAAVAERSGLRYELHATSGGFIGGQKQAVLEMLEGREDLPVTSWRPEAEAGLFGRPTLLSNAETFAQVAALCTLGVATYCRAGTRREPGTTLVTVAGDGPGGVVLEIPLGEPLAVVLHRCGYDPDLPALVGGYHGTWLPRSEVGGRRMSHQDLARVSATLASGVVLPLDPSACPVLITARIVQYLASQNARRCGPCTHGLPALARACADLAQGGGVAARHDVTRLAGLVDGRGACAHPDGTVRLIRSLVTAFPAEIAAHEAGGCIVTEPMAATS